MLFDVILNIFCTFQHYATPKECLENNLIAIPPEQFYCCRDFKRSLKKYLRLQTDLFLLHGSTLTLGSTLRFRR